MMLTAFDEEEYLRFAFWFQALIVVAIIVVLALAVTNVVDNWSDWVVLGVIVGTSVISVPSATWRGPTRPTAIG